MAYLPQPVTAPEGQRSNVRPEYLPAVKAVLAQAAQDAGVKAVRVFLSGP